MSDDERFGLLVLLAPGLIIAIPLLIFKAIIKV